MYSETKASKAHKANSTNLIKFYFFNRNVHSEVYYLTQSYFLRFFCKLLRYSLVTEIRIRSETQRRQMEIIINHEQTRFRSYKFQRKRSRRVNSAKILTLTISSNLCCNDHITRLTNGCTRIESACFHHTLPLYFSNDTERASKKAFPRSIVRVETRTFLFVILMRQRYELCKNLFSTIFQSTHELLSPPSWEPQYNFKPCPFYNLPKMHTVPIEI